VNRENKPYCWTEKTILIAEDSELIFLLLKKNFERTGAKIFHARNGQEAIDFFTSGQRAELVIMDIHLPIVDGLEAARQIKELMPATRIVAQSGSPLQDSEKGILPAPFEDYFLKPVDFIEMNERINKLFFELDLSK
jgi:CheY-like chemotaxis protein